MAIILDGGGTTFDYLLYGERDRGLTSYLHQLRESAVAHLGAAAQGMANELRQTVDRFYDSDAMRRTRAAVRAVVNAYGIDELYPLANIGQLQHAPPKAIPIVMAEPTLRKLYQQQRVEGYGDEYVDYEPNECGEGHTDYERVVDGVFQFGDDDTAEATTYLHLEDDQLLDHDVQMDIQMITWEQIRIALQKGKEDPTSRFNTTLG